MEEVARKYGAVVTVPSSVRTDSLAVSGFISPPAWERPDRNPFPRFTFWPAIDRAQALAGLARERITDAVHVLRHGLPEEDW